MIAIIIGISARLDIHHGGVELEAVIGWTNMVANAKEALSTKSKTHGVEDAQLLQDALSRLVIVFRFLFVG